jgi:uncharacterized protein (DUF433 family)
MLGTAKRLSEKPLFPGKSLEKHKGFGTYRTVSKRRSPIRSWQEGDPTMATTSPVVHSDPDILGGTPVFAGTRVPVRTLFDYVAAGDTLEEFLDHFPTVSREQAVAALEQANDLLVAHAHSS